MRALADRRDAIAATYLTGINPIVDLNLTADGALTFTNAAVEGDYARVPRGYIAQWSTFDNATQGTESIGETSRASTTIAAPRSLPRGEAAFVKVEISAVGSVHASWARPTSAYFRYDHGGWKLVGVERIGE